jgi:arylsulfatase A-like enzyme
VTNLVVYVSDALRADHLGCYGARSIATPTIDEFARGGVRFDQAIATGPWTCPSVASMITGQHPHHHGYLHWDADLDPSLPTLFSVAAAYGYETGSFVFDENYLFRGLADANVAGTTERVDGAIEWIRSRREQPFCLWFHSWATHMDFDIPHSDRERWRAAKKKLVAGIQSDSASSLETIREHYRRAVERQSEELFASFLEALDDLGLREQTVVVFVSDHGESWGERYRDKSAVKGAFQMHGASLYDEAVDVPLIIVAPDLLEPATVESQVSLVDLMPTLTELLGIPIDGLDGGSLIPLANGSERGDREALIAATDRGVVSQLAVRQPPWKVIRRLDNGDIEAYRIDLDPRERRDRAAEVPEELRARLRAEFATIPRHTLTREEEAIVERRLADLGYV